MEQLREISRQRYLEKREEKELKLLEMGTKPLNCYSNINYVAYLELRVCLNHPYLSQSYHVDIMMNEFCMMTDKRRLEIPLHQIHRYFNFLHSLFLSILLITTLLLYHDIRNA